MATRLQEYRDIKEEHPYGWCWACGRDDAQKLKDWFAPWWVERSHIVRSPREEDRRLIVLLCSWCHQSAHGARIVIAERVDWPRMTLANMLWLKLKRDPEFYDRDFLQRFRVQTLPVARPLPLIYTQEYVERRGDFHWGAA